MSTNFFTTKNKQQGKTELVKLKGKKLLPFFLEVGLFMFAETRSESKL